MRVPSPHAAAEAIGSAWRRLLASWSILWADRRTIAFLGLVSATITSAMIVPVVTWLVERLVESSGRAAVSDFELAAFVLSPVGLAGSLLVAGALVLARDLAEALVHRRLEHPERPPRATLVDTAARLPRLLVAGVALSAALGLAAAPFLVLLYLVARTLLVHDINYYLDARPPEWRLAVVLGGATAVAGGLALLGVAAAFLRVTPLVVVDGLGPIAAIRESARRFRATPGHTVATIVVHGVTTFAAGLVLTFFSVRIGLLVLESMPDHAEALVVVATGVFAAKAFVVAAANFLAIALIAPMIRRLDGRDAADRSVAPARGHAGIAAIAWIAAIAVATFGSYFAVARIGERAIALPDTAIVAHRGGTPEAGENTLVAFREAIADGADWIELDVQRDADGTVVVLHDRDFRRVAGDPRRLEDLSADEWRPLAIQAWKRKPHGGERAPTLAEVLTLDFGTTGLLIELKAYRPDPGLVPEVVRILAETTNPPKVRVMSFDSAAIEEFDRLWPAVETGLLVKAVAGDIFRVKADFLAISAELATTEFLDRAERSGRDLFVWGVDTEEDMLRLMALGVQGIVTDDVELARRIRARFEAMTPSEVAALVVRTRLRE